MLISKTAICRSFGIRKKIIELRDWNTKLTGKILDTCFKNIDNGRSESLGIDYKKLVQGAIIGVQFCMTSNNIKRKLNVKKIEISIMQI